MQSQKLVTGCLTAAHQIKMEVIRMGFIIAGPKHGREAFAGIRADFIEKATAPKRKNALALNNNFLAAIERDRANINGVAIGMLRPTLAARDFTT